MCCELAARLLPSNGNMLDSSDTTLVDSACGLSVALAGSGAAAAAGSCCDVQQLALMLQQGITALPGVVHSVRRRLLCACCRLQATDKYICQAASMMQARQAVRHASLALQMVSNDV